MIDSAPLHAPMGGGQQRSNLLYRALKQLGEVDLFLTVEPSSLSTADHHILRIDYSLVGAAAPRRRGSIAPWSFIRPAWPELVDRLAHNFGSKRLVFSEDKDVAPLVSRLLLANKYDLIVGRYLLPSVKCGILEQPIPTIVDIDDFEPQVYEDRLRAPNLSILHRAVIRHHVRQLRQHMPRIIGKARHLWVSCPDDADMVDHPSVSTLWNVPYVVTPTNAASSPASRANSNEVLLVASFNHPPNLRGADWFVTCVWPEVVSKRPEARLRLVGRGVPDNFKAKWHRTTNITVAGFTQNLENEYQLAAIAVAPIFEGGGTKIKVLEGLQHGLPFVATSHALRGYQRHLKHEDSLLVADTPSDFAKGILHLLGNREYGSSLGIRGANVINKHFSSSTFFDHVAETVSRIVAPKRSAN